MIVALAALMFAALSLAHWRDRPNHAVFCGVLAIVLSVASFCGVGP